MPDYALALISALGLIMYISLGTFLGTRVYVILQRPDVCGSAQYHDHEVFATFAGIFWPMIMPVFTAWYLAKHSKFNYIFKEG